MNFDGCEDGPALCQVRQTLVPQGAEGGKWPDMLVCRIMLLNEAEMPCDLNSAIKVTFPCRLAGQTLLVSVLSLIFYTVEESGC